MRAGPILLTIAITVLVQRVLAQGTAFIDDRLPPASVELKPHDSPATATPWELPKPGDPLYDAKKEADIKNNNHSHWAHAFERGVFKGYVTITSGPPPEATAKKTDSAFTPNPRLPPDAVELSSSEHGDKSDYFQTRPETRPANVPSGYILVRVFHGKTFLGWTYISKEAVAALHKPKKT
jgi:hypothetical protein